MYSGILAWNDEKRVYIITKPSGYWGLQLQSVLPATLTR